MTTPLRHCTTVTTLYKSSYLNLTPELRQPVRNAEDIPDLCCSSDDRRDGEILGTFLQDYKGSFQGGAPVFPGGQNEGQPGGQGQEGGSGGAGGGVGFNGGFSDGAGSQGGAGGGSN
jgi:uncharacterized membrane protein YgcG